MSVRINKAKNFKGKAYVAADELDNLIKSMTFYGADATGTDVWKINFTNLDGTPATTSAVDLTAIKEYIDNKAITVKPGAGIQVITSDSADSTVTILNPKIKADIDSATIVWSGTGDSAKLATGLKIKKLTTATTGFAASYQLVDANDNPIDGENTVTIDIVKDQFIKSATFGWSTAADSTGAGWTTTKSATAKYPCIKIEVWTNIDGDTTSSDTTATPIYVPLNDVFQEYVGSNGVEIVSGNVIQGVVDTTNSEKVYTAAGTSSAVLTVGANGFKIANIQAAIDNAIGAEHLTASAAVDAVELKVDTLVDNTSSSVAALNTRIATVANNASTAIANASANLTSKITGVATNAQNAVQAVGAAVDALDTSVSAAIDDVNTNVESAIDSLVSNVNTAMTATVSTVNTNVNAAVTTVNTKVNQAVSNVNSQVAAFKDTVSATVSAVNSAVTDLKDSVNTVISSVETNIGTRIANAVQVVESNVTVGTGAVTSGIATVTVQANNIVAVYDPNGYQIYPDITRGATPGNKPYTYTLQAEYGETTPDATWTVLCTLDLPAYDNGGDVAYTNGTNTVAYSEAGNGTAASYSDATATSVGAVDATDVEYTKGTAVANTTVADGTAGTASTAVATGTAAGTPSKGTDVVKDAPEYKVAAEPEP